RKLFNPLQFFDRIFRKQSLADVLNVRLERLRKLQQLFGFALQFEGISSGVQRRRFGLGDRRNLTSRLRRMWPVVPRLRINGRAEQHDQARWEKKFHGYTLAELLRFYCYSAYR